MHTVPAPVFSDEDPSRLRKMFRDTRAIQHADVAIMREFTRARIESSRPNSILLVTLRQISEASMHVRVTNLIL